MNLRPDIHTALFIGLVSLATFFVWRTVAGTLAKNTSTESVAKGMLSISG